MQQHSLFAPSLREYDVLADGEQAFGDAKNAQNRPKNGGHFIGPVQKHDQQENAPDQRNCGPANGAQEGQLFGLPAGATRLGIGTAQTHLNA